MTVKSRKNKSLLPMILLLSTLTLVGFSLTLGGCQPKRPATEGRLALPAEGRVRVIAGNMVQTGDNQTAHWSIIGERNWNDVSIQEGTITLKSSSPLNDAAKTPNSNIWEIDLVVQKAQNNTKTATLTLHGTSGKQQQATFEIPEGPSEVMISTKADQDISLPATLSLALLGKTEITLSIAP